ncbi:MAG TPA: lycopene cyclase domain-containing protein [Flavobacteriaceae bacterium]|nr:lycopene cyclase domain-containing protein [Flavobacteriaceae bacterium]
MLQSSTYLLINFFTILICLIASFDKRIRFDKHFGTFLLSSTIVAVPFIAWDIWFTDMGVWWFNTDYTTGVILAGLPIEEWMFFYFIPFACVFTYFCFDKFFDLSWANSLNNVLVFFTTISCAVVVLLYYDKIYTFITALVTLLTILYLHFISKREWIGQASLVFLVLMVGFFFVNGVLTGTGLESPIVNYNPDEFSGIRMLTIPVEDAVYGYSQFMLNVYFFQLLRKK